MDREACQRTIDLVVTALVAAPSTSDLAGPTQLAMTETTEMLIADPGYVLAARADAAKQADRELPPTSSHALKAFAAEWYFAGMTRGIAAAVAVATER